MGLAAKKRCVRDNVTRFLHAQFPIVMANMSEEERTSMHGYVSVILHSHRHNKNNGFMQTEEGKSLDFDTVRDVMYKYSKKSQRRFFDVPVLAFLLHHFASHQRCEEQIKLKYASQDEEYRAKIREEVRELNAIAIEAMNEKDFFGFRH